MQFEDFIHSLSVKGESIIPSSSALSLYAGQSQSILELYSTVDYVELIREGFSYSFLQHPLWDVFFELPETIICYKTVTRTQLKRIRYNHPVSQSLPSFSLQLPAGTYFDPAGTRFNLKYEKEAGTIKTSSLYYYLKYLLISAELKEYHITVHYTPLNKPSDPHDIEWTLFNLLLTHKKTAFFVEQLVQSNVLFKFFPQLEVLGQIDQDKDYHPEGNVLEHTTACFQHFKRPSLTLSLATLFHDIGKAYSSGEVKNKPFYKHSSMSAVQVKKALRQDIYSQQVRDNVQYLVRYHMYPPFLFYRSPKTIERITGHQGFGELLKLYRADLLSTGQDNDAYQKVLRQYKEYKKNTAGYLHALD